MAVDGYPVALLSTTWPVGLTIKQISKFGRITDSATIQNTTKYYIILTETNE